MTTTTLRERDLKVLLGVAPIDTDNDTLIASSDESGENARVEGTLRATLVTDKVTITHERDYMLTKTNGRMDEDHPHVDRFIVDGGLVVLDINGLPMDDRRAHEALCEAATFLDREQRFSLIA